MEQTRVLVVEDDPTGGMVVKAQLSKLGYDVAPVLATGEAAIEWAEQHRPDVVVMDIELVGARIQGPEAANIIYEKLSIPVVFLSGRADDDAFDLIRGTNSYGFVAKPPRQRELALSLELALDKHRLEEELRESSARMSAILNTALDSIITIDREGFVVEFNPAAEKTFGLSRREVIGRQMADLIIPQDLRQAHREGLRRFLATGRSSLLNRRMEFSALRSDGSIFPLEIAVSSLQVNNEQFFTAYARDITDRKENESKLRLRDRLLQGAARATDSLLTVKNLQMALPQSLQILGASLETDRVYICQNVGNGSGPLRIDTIHEWRSEYMRGLSSEPAWASAEECARNFTRWYDTLASGETISGISREFQEPEREQLRKRGIVSILLAPIMLGGRFWGFIGFENCAQERIWSDNERNIILAMAGSIAGAIARNTSEDALRKSREKLATQYQELDQSKNELAQATGLLVQQEKLATLGTIAGSVAHEINSPLGAILNCAERLHDDDLTASARLRNVQLILNAAVRCKNVIAKFLDSSVRSDTGETLCNIKSVIDDWFELYGKQLVHHEIIWAIELENDFELALSETECMQVITNIILNARDALVDSERQVQGLITIRAHPEGDFGIVEITDNGPGFPPELLPTIYEPFISTKEKGKGTGLGLYITRKIIEEAGGTIEIVNSESGATVTASIPLAKQ